MKSVYTTKNKLYDVVVLDETGENYGVRNLDTECIEYKTDALPQTIGVAEQYDFMLTYGTWTSVIENMFGPEEDWQENPQLELVPTH